MQFHGVWTGAAVGVVLAITTAGCLDEADLELEEASAELAEASPELTESCDPYDPATAWCNGWDNGSWHNGYGSWHNGSWHNGSWHNGSWHNGWANSWQTAPGQTGLTNSWAIGWTLTWGSRWQARDFDRVAWGWALASGGPPHPLSRPGAPLTYGNPLSLKTCEVMPSCCAAGGAWTPACVAKALDLADDYTGHSVLEAGPALPIATSRCTQAVCHAKTKCCTTGWDDDCVAAAADICTNQYLANTRVDPTTDRVMVDVCTEPKVQGYPACALEGSGIDQQECCTSALVLEGVYQAMDDDPVTGPHIGRPVHWWRARQIATPWGTKPVSATIVPNPCVTLDGATTQVCQDQMHKLWAAAGPGAPLYPDSRITPGNRGQLLAALSALITTRGSYQVDLRNAPSASPAPFTYAPEFDNSPPEARWHYSGPERVLVENNTYTEHLYGKALCYHQYPDQRDNSDWRANGDLVANVPRCREGVEPVDESGATYSYFALVWFPFPMH